MSTRSFPGPIWTQPAPGRRKPRFTREQIAELAVRIADDEGFAALSMRRIADELDAGTMTLYYYVRTKDDLIELMNDALMAELLISEHDLAAGWRHALTQIARASYETFRRHPWALSALRGARFGPNSLAHFEQSLAAAASAPFGLAAQLDVVGIVDDYVYGHVLRAYEVVSNAEFGGGAPSAAIVAFMQAQIDTGAYPHMRALVGDASEPAARWTEVTQLLNDEHRFERGLAALFDGLEHIYADPEAIAVDAKLAAAAAAAAVTARGRGAARRPRATSPSAPRAGARTPRTDRRRRRR